MLACWRWPQHTEESGTRASSQRCPLAADLLVAEPPQRQIAPTAGVDVLTHCGNPTVANPRGPRGGLVVGHADQQLPCPAGRWPTHDAHVRHVVVHRPALRLVGGPVSIDAPADGPLNLSQHTHTHTHTHTFFFFVTYNLMDPWAHMVGKHAHTHTQTIPQSLKPRAAQPSLAGWIGVVPYLRQAQLGWSCRALPSFPLWPGRLPPMPTSRGP